MTPRMVAIGPNTTEIDARLNLTKTGFRLWDGRRNKSANPIALEKDARGRTLVSHDKVHQLPNLRQIPRVFRRQASNCLRLLQITCS